MSSFPVINMFSLSCKCPYQTEDTTKMLSLTTLQVAQHPCQAADTKKRFMIPAL